MPTARTPPTATAIRMSSGVSPTYDRVGRPVARIRALERRAERRRVRLLDGEVVAVDHDLEQAVELRAAQLRRDD